MALACDGVSQAATPEPAADASPAPLVLESPTIRERPDDGFSGARVTIILPPLRAGEVAVMEIISDQTNYVGVTTVRITVTRDTREAIVTIERVPPPSLVTPPSQKIFSYLEITAGQISDDAIKEVTIDFTVPTAWLKENQITEEDIVLLRLVEGSWTGLNTKRVDTSPDMVSYQAVSPGLSLFSISSISTLLSDVLANLGSFFNESSETESGQAQSSPVIETEEVLLVRKFFVAAGHGGGKPGAPYHGTTESLEVIEIVDDAFNYLQGRIPPGWVLVKVPHELDLGATNKWITARASWQADLAVEVHLDAPSQTVSGPLLIVTESEKEVFAPLLELMAISTGQPSRGYWWNRDKVWDDGSIGWGFINFTGTRAAILEADMLSNPDRAAIIKNTALDDIYGEGLARGILKIMNSNVAPNAPVIRNEPELLSPPRLIKPFNLDSGVSTTPTFSWTQVDGAKKYWLMVATSPLALPSVPKASSCLSPGCKFDIAVSSTDYILSDPLANSTTYYWQVQAFNDGVTPIRQGQYSEQGLFTTEGKITVNPALSVSYTSLNFGSTGTLQPLSVTNSGGGTLSWSVSDNQSWLSVSPTSGTTTTETDSVTVSVNRSGLSAGTYSGTLTVSSNGGTQTVTVTMQVATLDPVLGFSSASFDFGSTGTSLSRSVTNSGGGTLSWSVSDNQSWLSVSPTSGTTTTETDSVTVSVNR
ncbi:MAG: PGF-pre-PGF domain-containing protein, partial [Chloroflexi bacterium]|nr:PGF-pre-PGF domain-containing protein [Chloroflexota bacterium]